MNLNEDVFKFKFDHGGEYDMAIYSKRKHTCRIYEIKHSAEIVERQTEHLMDAKKCGIVETRFGKITDKYVLYRGTNTSIDDVQYLNVEQFLCNLKRSKHHLNIPAHPKKMHSGIFPTAH
jgi:hypothetical protein